MQSQSTPPDIDVCRGLYRTMVRIRLVEECLAELLELVPERREVRCPCHLYIGQEAIAAGVCAPLRTDDTIWGAHRSHGHYIAKGGGLGAMMAEIFGKVTGCSQGRGGSMHLFAPEVGVLGTVPLVAATIPLAVGAGLASWLHAQDRVAVAFFGDGATEEGHFHESMNLAALHSLPVVFVCENNFYASHMELSERRRCDNIHMSGPLHGMPGIRLDGNDVLAVYEASAAAVARARGGEGPSLLECRTYRWRGHVGPAWDMDVGVERKDELAEWLPKDPIARHRAYLLERDVEPAWFSAVDEHVRKEIEAAVEFARDSEFPAPNDVYAHLFSSEQEDELCAS